MSRLGSARVLYWSHRSFIHVRSCGSSGPQQSSNVDSSPSGRPICACVSAGSVASQRARSGIVPATKEGGYPKIGGEGTGARRVRGLGRCSGAWWQRQTWSVTKAGRNSAHMLATSFSGCGAPPARTRTPFIEPPARQSKAYSAVLAALPVLREQVVSRGSKSVRCSPARNHVM